MATKTGLRTELVISTVLLLGAALLFAGFLLVKLTERELLEERRQSLRRTARLLAAVEPSADSLATLLQPFIREGSLVAWRYLAADHTPLRSFSAEMAGSASEPPLMPIAGDATDEVLHYSSAWPLFGGNPAAFLDLAVHTGGDSGNILQLRFSLASLVAQVHDAQRLMLTYVVLYGGVLSLFGIYVLNRNVVEPVRRLGDAVVNVASGDLTPLSVPQGPGEIVELAEAFNGMIAALHTSRAETAAHISSMEDANRALHQARDEVVRAEKMASVGHLSAGMAHEIGNPLSAAIGYLNLLRAELTDAALRDLVERALLEAGRIDRLVRDLLDYAAPVRATNEPFDPLAAFRDTVVMLVNQGSLEGIQVCDRAPPTLGQVCMDRSRFMQVCVNLLLNARDAMPAGGEITLDGRHQEPELLLTVTDTGEGIPPELLPRIFEPFFTTKDPGKGQGLGLAVCQRLISEAGGRLEVQSTPGRGSCFTVRLPVAGEDA